MNIGKLMLKSEYFKKSDGYFEIYPPVHPSVIENGLNEELARSCLTSEIVNMKFEEGNVEIDEIGVDFGMAQNFRYDNWQDSPWPVKMKLPDEIIEEYGLNKENNGIITFPAVWMSHNLGMGNMRELCFNFAISYGNEIVSRKYNG